MGGREIVEKADRLGDWRIAAVTTLAQDLPATASGVPAHKAGARLALVTSTKAPDGKSVGFTTPSATAMALNLAMRSVEQAQAIREAFVFDDVVAPTGSEKAIRQEAELFDYFEHCMIITTFSFQALEAYCNQTVADNMKVPVQVERRREGKKQSLTLNTPAEVERTATTEEQLAIILPSILGMASPRGKAVWGQFVTLKRARDATIHLKADDQYPNRKAMGLQDESSLFYQFLYQDMAQFPRASTAMIHYFARRTVVPRWLEHPLEVYGLNQ
jgi:hypothetical protein